MLLASVDISVSWGAGGAGSWDDDFDRQDTLEGFDFDQCGIGLIGGGNPGDLELWRRQNPLIGFLTCKHQVDGELKGAGIFTAADKSEVIEFHQYSPMEISFDLKSSCRPEVSNR